MDAEELRFYLVFGSLLILLSILLAVKNILFFRKCIKTTGIVTKHLKSKSGKLRGVTFYRVRFTDKDNVVRDFRSHLGVGVPKIGVGGHVEVIYNRNNSTQAYINGVANKWFMEIIVFLIGATLLLMYFVNGS